MSAISGEVQNGTTIHKNTPVQVSGLTGVSAIAGGAYHAVALKNDGTVWAWGSNFTGQIGDGTTIYKNTPVLVGGLTSVVAVNAGGSYSFAIAPDATAPTGSITIDGGSASTTSTSVTLTLSCADAESACSQMQFSNDGTTWSAWETYSTSRAWTLSDGDGTKTVYAQFNDGAGNESVSYTDTILFSSDIITPTGAIIINASNTIIWSVKTPPTASVIVGSGMAAINGDVYMVGGWDGGFINTVKKYSPATGWTTVAPLPAVLEYGAVESVNGKLYVIGGWNGGSNLNTVYEYDPAVNNWTTKTPMPTS